MKPSWVLSDEERNRRFNKFNKLNVKSVNPEDRKSRPAAASQLRLPELYMTFTMEEQKLIDDIQKKFTFCQKAWLRNLLIFGRFVFTITMCILQANHSHLFHEPFTENLINSK